MTLTIAIEVQGDLLAIANRSGRTPKGGKRGTVTSFSPAARLRLMRKLSRLRADKAVFMTLTYPERYPSPKIAKQHLRAFLERFRRRWPKASAVWRIEPQKRGAPHFHLIWYNLPYVHIATVRLWWAATIQEYMDGETLQVNMKMCWNSRMVGRYISKYVAKVTDADYSAYDGGCFLDDGAYLHVGRWWGLHNAQHMPWAERIVLIFTAAEMGDLARCKALMRTFWPYLNDDAEKGGVIFTELAYEVLHEIAVMLKG